MKEKILKKISSKTMKLKGLWLTKWKSSLEIQPENQQPKRAQILIELTTKKKMKKENERKVERTPKN